MKSKWYILLVPYFLISLSYTPLVVPYIFIAALIIKHMNLKRRKSLC
jgi:Na+/melibiose symporter-like transporter